MQWRGFLHLAAWGTRAGQGDVLEGHGLHVMEGRGCRQRVAEVGKTYRLLQKKTRQGRAMTQLATGPAVWNVGEKTKNENTGGRRRKDLFSIRSACMSARENEQTKRMNGKWVEATTRKTQKSFRTGPNRKMKYPHRTVPCDTALPDTVLVINSCQCASAMACRYARQSGINRN